jgi:hypothetical protein
MKAALAFVVLAACSHARPVASTLATPSFAGDAAIDTVQAARLDVSLHDLVGVANRSVEQAKAALVDACERNLLVKDCHP